MQTILDNPKMTICVKNCTGSDPIHGIYNVTFAQSKQLSSVPGYQWVDGNGNHISSVKCDVKHFGGPYETFTLDYTWECTQGYHKRSNDNRCVGK